jgi:hypothetical protein
MMKKSGFRKQKVMGLNPAMKPKMPTAGPSTKINAIKLSGAKPTVKVPAVKIKGAPVAPRVNAVKITGPGYVRPVQRKGSAKKLKK